MKTEEHKLVFRRFVEEALGAGHIDIIPDLVTDDFLDHGAMPGQEPGCAGLIGKVASIRRAFPDLNAQILMLFGEDDLVGGQVRLTGTHQGSLMGIGPTNRRIDVTEFHVWRFAGGRGQEHWEGGDKLALLQQLGFELAPPRST